MAREELPQDKETFDRVLAEEVAKGTSQRVAEGIYQGVAGYLQSMNSMTLNLQPGTAPRRPPVVSTVEESRNQK